MKTQNSKVSQQATDRIKAKEKFHHSPEKRSPEENENLGLDADGSSTAKGLYAHLNSDNDRIAGNPDGEDDDKNTKEPAGHSPIMDK